jgi:hypothetical protein
MDESRGSDPRNPTNSILARRASQEDRSVEHFAAPLGPLRSGHLRFTKGAHRVVIRAELHLRDLYRASFGKRTPTVTVQRGIVTIRNTRFPTDDWLDCRSERPAEVALNPSIHWAIDVRGGATRLVADLRGLRLGSLRLDGGASRLEVMLPAPSGTVSVLMLGGASNIAIDRPEGVSARLCVEGGVTNLRFDDRRIGGAGGEVDLRSTDYDGATGRYDIAITGGANNVSVERRRGEERGET